MKKTLILLILMAWRPIISQSYFELTPDGLRPANNPGKDFCILNFDGMDQEQLYKNFLIQFTSMYVSPKDVISKVENEVITINGFSKRAIVYKIGKNPAIEFDISYTITFMFKDGAVRINPPSIISMERGENSLLINGASGFFSNSNLIYKSGELKSLTAKESIEGFFQALILSIKSEINNRDW